MVASIIYAVSVTCSTFIKIFKRIRISTFAQLVLQVDQVNKMSMSADAAANSDESSPLKDENGTYKGTEHPTFLDVINGTGELALKDQNYKKSLPPKPQVEILLQPYQQM